LNSAREFSERVGACHELAQPRWPDISWRVQKTGKRLEARNFTLPAKPVDFRITDENFNFGARFVQESAGFKRALSTPYHQDLFAPKADKITVVTTMRCQLSGQILKFRWTPGEWGNPGGNHDPRRIHNFAVLGRDVKASGYPSYASDLAPVKIRNSLLLEPETIVNEAFQRNGRRQVIPSGCRISFEFQATLGVCNVRGIPGRAEEHSPRHVAPPERHWLPKDSQAKTGDGAQMCGCGQAVGPGPNDYNIKALQGDPSKNRLSHSSLRTNQKEASAEPSPTATLTRGEDGSKS
jgi:hypothetical protein